MYIIKYFNDAYQLYLNGTQNKIFIDIFIEKSINYISSNIKYYCFSLKSYNNSDPVIFNNDIIGYFTITPDLKLSHSEQHNYNLFLLYLGILIYNSKTYIISSYVDYNYNIFSEILNSINYNIIITTNDDNIFYHNTKSIKLLQFVTQTAHISYINLLITDIFTNLSTYIKSNQILRNKKFKLSHMNSYFNFIINSIEYDNFIYNIFTIDYNSPSVNISKNIIGLISHELRNPLQTINLASSILDQQSTNNSISKYLKMIISSSNLMKIIINDILDFDKIINNQLTLNISKINVSFLIKEIIDNFNENNMNKNISFELLFGLSTTKYIYSDSVKIKQILINLITNAIKYSKKKTHNNICIKIYSDLLNIYIDVADNGIGIRSENIPDLFNLYSQTVDSISESNGIGLFLSKQLAKILGGDISIKSSHGIGSTFIFKHPLKLGSPYDDINDIDIISDYVKKYNKILICDDNQINSSLLKTILLTIIDSQIEIVTNGESAFDLIKINSYDLIFIDINIGQMDGYSCVKLIRNYFNSSIPITPNVSTVATPLIDISFNLDFNPDFSKLNNILVKIIAITGDNLDNVDNKYFDQILFKPFDSKDLIKLFRKL